MRTLNLQQLVEKLRDQQLKKHDMIVPSSCLQMNNGSMRIVNTQDNAMLMDILARTGIASSNQLGKSILELSVLDICHEKIRDKLKIPAQYYDRMLNEGHLPLLDMNVNYWLDKAETNYLVRTFIDAAGNTGVMRALLSDRFKVIDNYDVLMAALDAIKQSGVRVEIKGCELTDKRMYVHVEAPHVVIDSPTLLSKYRVPNGGASGDTGIIAGFILTNSETGNGTFSVTPRLVVRACTNGMIIKQDAQRKHHIGARLDEYTQIDWSEETQQKNLELIVSQTKDAVRTFMSEDYLGKAVQALEESASKKLTNPIDAVCNVSAELKYSEQKQKDILNYFVEGGDQTAFGVSQAITYYAHAKAGADEQYDMEREAFDILADIEKFDKPVKVATRRQRSTRGFLNN